VIPTVPDLGGFLDEIPKVSDESVAAELQDGSDYLAKSSTVIVADKIEVNTKVREGSVGG
jgi:hypothetical protein